MAEINLLPWREARREREKKEFIIYLSAGLLLAVFIVGGAYFYTDRMVDNQANLNRILQEEINSLERQIKEIAKIKKTRAALIARMNIVKNLQATRVMTVHLFDELVKIIPNGVYLTEIQREGSTVKLMGFAESNSSVSQLMRNIEVNKWLHAPRLTEIKKAKEATTTEKNQFILSFILTPRIDIGL